MFKYNLLSSYRNFKHSKSSFFINLIGLSSGLTCALLVFLWVNDEMNFDKFNKKDSQLFQVMTQAPVGNGIETSWATSCILADNLAKELPEVEFAVTAGPPENNKSMLSYENNFIKATALYAGGEYFNIFSYSLLQGDAKQVLSVENSIVISEKLATKLFQTTDNVIGKTIQVDQKTTCSVSGIFKGAPANSSIQFDCVLPYQLVIRKFPGIDVWGQDYWNTFLVLRKGTDINQFNKKITGIFQKKSGNETATLFVRPYSSKYLYDKYENGVQSGGRIEYVKLFSVIAIFILFIACINFMNLSTAKASGRMKEVGIKKANGADRKSLVFQFLQESVLMSFLSLLAALALVALVLPQFNSFTGKQLTLNFHTNMILAVLGITLFTGLISGSYPALFLSGLAPMSMLNRKIKDSVGEIWIRKGMVVFQFTISVILIISVLVVYKQIDFIQNTKPGYDKDNVICFEKEGKIADNLETFLSEVKSIPGVVNASSMSWNLVGNGGSTDGVRWQGKNPDVKTSFYLQYINYDLIETMGIDMKEGRTYSRNFGSDQSKIIFNEAAIKSMGIKNPIGEVINLWGNDKQIIGVTKNFHFQSLHEEIKPSLFILYSGNNSQIIVKIKSGMEKATLDKLSRFYQGFNPGFPFNFRFLDQDYQAQYVAENRVAVLSRFFAGLAILISCLGLFGLAAYSAEKKSKEIGIRKINGAGAFNIINLLSGEFIRIVGISILIAFPISYIIARNWLDSFVYKTPLSLWIFLLAGFAALFIAFATVSWQSWRAATRNPVEALRNE
jgi:ABC-type antimicrobial peptide transport system permease subunit